MLISMTGYGRAKSEAYGREITVEVKSVNNRYLDCNVKIPRSYIFAEDAIKKRIQAAVGRGKVDVFITITDTAEKEVSISINRALVEGYLKAFKELEEYGLTNAPSVTEVARLPDVLILNEPEEDLEEFKSSICGIVDMALKQYNEMRRTEGQKLCDDIGARLDEIEKILTVVEKRSPETVSEYHKKLEQKLKEVLESTDIDEQRILTEAAIFADKVAINEELVRLHSHILQMRQMFDSEEPVGRKLDFLIQEMNREVNTIGSKGNDLDMARYVVALKAEIEKIREQVQNVE